MLKLDKQKDAKNKEKLDLSKSAQNLTYLLSPLNVEAHQCLSKLSRGYDLDKIDTIFQTQMDTQANMPFLKTPHNCFKVKQTNVFAYRSPYSNKYFPQIKDGLYPSPFVRNLQEKGGKLFEEYSKMYYGNCISNFFVQQNEDQFCFVFCVQKKYKQQSSQGIWNSLNVANISGDPSKSITYKVSTYVIYEISCTQDSDECKPFTINGNLKRTKNQSRKVGTDIEIEDTNLQVIGKIIQENQTYLRQQMESVFVRKTKDIIYKTRIPETKDYLEQHKKLMKNIMASSTEVRKEGVMQ